MKSIWKYELETTDSQVVKMPYHTLEERTILIIGTGHDISGPEGEYVGTYQLHDGNLIFHVFELVYLKPDYE